MCKNCHFGTSRLKFLYAIELYILVSFLLTITVTSIYLLILLFKLECIHTKKSCDTKYNTTGFEIHDYTIYSRVL